MGKLIAPLAQADLPDRTVFDRRVAVECGSRFELAWRNLRLELGAEEWVEFVGALEHAFASWRSHGSPRSQERLELARRPLEASVPAHPAAVEIELCELPAGALAPVELGVGPAPEEALVRCRYRDLRLELSVTEFLGLARAMSEARERVQRMAYRSLALLFEALEAHNVVYAVLRDWERLPAAVGSGPQSGLDLLVHPAHAAKVDELWNATRTQPETRRAQRTLPALGPRGEASFLLADLRTTDDGYLPEPFAHILLGRRVEHGPFYVPAPREHFLSLLYHVVVHEGVMSDARARALRVLAPAAGVDFPERELNNLGRQLALLGSLGLEPVVPDDPSALPRMPFIEPAESVIASRLLDVHQGLAYESRVYLLEAPDGTRSVRKQSTFELAEREAILLGRLAGRHFPRASAAPGGPGYSTCTIEYIDGFALAEATRFAESCSPAQAREFVDGCLEMLGELAAAGIVHRDIKPDNILVRDGQPVLIDFGWALAPDLPHVTPAGLGDEGRPADGFSDVYALGVALAELAAHHPELAPAVEAMTRAEAGERVTALEELRALLDAGAREPALAAGAAGLLALRLLAAGHPATAAAALQRALPLAPDSAALAAAAGTVALARGELDGAAAEFARALELDPGSGAARRGLADLATDLGRIDEAADAYAALDEPATVTIVIPVFNRLELTRQCLATLRATTPSGLYEVVVVDNASSDGTADYLRRERAARRLKAVLNETNMGFGRACNRAAGLARGEYVLFLNNDTIPKPGWLEAMLCTAADASVGAVGSRLLYPDGTLQHAGIALPEGIPTHVYRGEPADYAPALQARDYPAVTGASILLRRELLEALGGFDESYQMYVEDVDLCLRVWDAGLRVVYEPASVLIHLESASIVDRRHRDEQVRAGWAIMHGRWAGRWPAALPGGAPTPYAEPEPPELSLDGLRGFVALAFAAELVEHPELLSAYAAHFAADDDVTLAIYAPDRDAATVELELGRALERAGLDPAACPDLLAFSPRRAAATERALAARADAVFSEREAGPPFARLPRFRADELQALRQAAEATARPGLAAGLASG